MISVKKKFTLKRSQLAKKFRVENNNLDISSLIERTGHEVRRLGDLAPAHRHERNKKATAQQRFRYIQISDVDVELGRIRSYRSCLGSEAPNNARRLMAEGDVLVSTRRPTRGAVIAVPKDFHEHVCTVFFTSLRVLDREVLDPGYLALFLRTSLGRFQFQAMITETAYPVIGDDDVESMTILLPSIQAQRTLVASYEAAVSEYFNGLNAALRTLVTARQGVEDSVLSADAEKLAVPVVGLVHEVAAEEETETEEPSDEAD